MAGERFVVEWGENYFLVFYDGDRIQWARGEERAYRWTVRERAESVRAELSKRYDDVKVRRTT